MTPHWMSYVGMITGVIGALTGITGAVLGYLGYVRSREMKALDLRVDVQKERNNAHVKVVQLVELLDQALRSRVAVAAALGKTNSGAMVKFKEKLESDRIRTSELAAEVPRSDPDLSKQSPNELEKMLVKIHRTLGWISDITEYYERELQKDDRDRAH